MKKIFKKAAAMSLIMAGTLAIAGCKKTISLNNTFDSDEKKENVVIPFAIVPGGYYKTAFNTVSFFGGKIKAGADYKFKGELDKSGNVKDRVVIYQNVKGAEIEVENAQLTIEKVSGEASITVKVPENNGVLNKPFDTVPVLTVSSLDPKAKLNLPKGSKINIKGVISTIK